VVIVAVALLAAGSVAAGDECGGLEAGLWSGLLSSGMQMEPVGTRREIAREASDGLAKCPESEQIAYVALRATELLRGEPGPEWGRFVAELATRFPRSARIATVKARQDHTVESARRAVAADRNYLPARVALAHALLAAGDTEGARAALEGAVGLKGDDDAEAVLARVRWAQGDVAGAEQLARGVLQTRPWKEGEPGATRARASSQAHEVLGLAYLKKGQPDKAAPHLLAVDGPSKEARVVLDRPDPALKKALARARRSARRP
jgi:hypothetical protein